MVKFAKKYIACNECSDIIHTFILIRFQYVRDNCKSFIQRTEAVMEVNGDFNEGL